MGWTIERFGRFDRNAHGYSYGRSAHKPERIGKKYQWIAFHELLARLADNFKLKEDKWSGRGTEYQGPEDIRVHRDIDPSNLLQRTQREEWRDCTNTWWFPTEFNSWHNPDDEVEWLKKASDLPDAAQLIQVTNPADSSGWWTMDGYYKWGQPTPPGEERHETRRRELWYMLKCYLIRQSDGKTLLQWAKNQTWMNRWMPESHASYDVFLGECCWSPSHRKSLHINDGIEPWTRGDGCRVPVEIIVADDEYSWGSSGFDCSIDDTISIVLPCQFLKNEMNLEWRGQEGHWFGKDGKLAILDPSVRSRGPSVLLGRQDAVNEFLASRGLTLFWTILGERRTIGDFMAEAKYVGHLEINGAYLWENGQLSGTVQSRFITPSS